MSFILGLTGGIGSGKSAASHWFEQQGIQVVDADVVAREIVAVGELNRRALREHIFQDPSARKQLEKITHPAIRQSIMQQLQAATSPYAILVSPLLFETNQHELTQHTLLIDASTDIQILRASQRDHQTIEQIQTIIKAQISREQKQALADDIVVNDGHLEHLYAQLRPLHLKYLAHSEV
ncbi:MAG: dephospho-CoA kinase [Acinetobacter johnsonii]|uniref:Dephospho-CoA kinase n=1 Tax=Acinetobacter johnsonii TaxID=40214 RepID=A0A2W5RLE0_ACIJO|nr:MAG: dephospho-CoA kinase [Acinetobacter johnsonii]